VTRETCTSAADTKTSHGVCLKRRVQLSVRTAAYHCVCSHWLRSTAHIGESVRCSKSDSCSSACGPTTWHGLCLKRRVQPSVHNAACHCVYAHSFRTHIGSGSLRTEGRGGRVRCSRRDFCTSAADCARRDACTIGPTPYCHFAFVFMHIDVRAYRGEDRKGALQ
jgi:hypothetical protein